MAPTLNVIGIVVDDMPTSLAFYRRFGLDIPASADAEPHVEAKLSGGMRLAFDAAEVVRSYAPQWRPPEGGGHRIALAFQCADPGEVDRLYAELVEAGYVGEKDPWDAFWGQRYAVVHDPDGNSVELYAASAGLSSSAS